MALGVAEFLNAPFFTSSVTPDPSKTSWVSGILYKLHTMTGTLLFLMSCFVYVRELLGDHIHCITDGSDSVGQLVPLRAFESYCYISDTFTLPRQETSKMDIGAEIHPGVGPIGSNTNKEFVYHNYYMWIPYLLFLQSISFYIPYILHRFLQDGRAELLLMDLQNVIANPDPRDDKYGDISFYFKDWYNHQDWWAIKTVICEMLNLLVIVLNVLLVDWYLGHQFYLYGIESIKFIASNVQLRGIDPFNLIFPKMTKCTLETYGPSGTIQNFDGLCVLPINVLNEKIFFLTWFVFLFLFAFTFVYSLIAGVILSVKNYRNSFLLLYISPERPLLRRKLLRILNLSGFGDWMMLYLIARNTDRVVFGQLITELKYPDYRHDLEPSDEENLRLDRLIEENTEKRKKSEKMEKDDFYGETKSDSDSLYRR